MPPLMQLPAYEIRNALVNFQPINDAIDSHRAFGLKQREADLRDKQFGLDEQRLSIQKRSADQEFMHKTAVYAGGVAQQIDSITDPAQKTAAWSQFIDRHPNKANLPAQYLDPMQGPKLVVAEARGWVNPLDDAAKRAQIASTSTSTALHNQQLAQQREIGPYQVQQAKLAAATAQREFDTPKENIQKVKEDESIVRINPRTGAAERVYGNDPADGETKDYRKAYGKELGEARAKAVIDLPRVVDNADEALRTIDAIRQHPGRGTGTGLTGMALPYVPGTDARGFSNLVDQAKGKTFLEAFNALRGGGAITEAEGAKATQAMARLDRSQSKADFDAALGDLQQVITIGAARAKRLAAGNYTATPTRQMINAAPADTAPPTSGPRPGTVMDGYLFKGGNPADQNAWEKVR